MLMKSDVDCFSFSILLSFKNMKNLSFLSLIGALLFSCVSTEHNEDPRRLHNLWMITAVDGVEVGAEDFSRDVPVIEINMTEGTFAGSNGCNQIRGPISEEQGKIRFGMAVSTRMACQKAEYSERITELLTDREYRYVFTKNSLTFYLDNTEVLRFRNVD